MELTSICTVGLGKQQENLSYIEMDSRQVVGALKSQKFVLY